MALSNNIKNNEVALSRIKKSLGGNLLTLNTTLLYSNFKASNTSENELVTDVENFWEAGFIDFGGGLITKIKAQLKKKFEGRKTPFLVGLGNFAFVMFYPKFQSNGGAIKILYKEFDLSDLVDLSNTLFENLKNQNFLDDSGNLGKIPWFAITGTLFKTGNLIVGYTLFPEQRFQNGYVYRNGIRVLLNNSDLPSFPHTMSLEYSKNNNAGERFSFRYCEHSEEQFELAKAKQPFGGVDIALSGQEGLGGLYPIFRKTVNGIEKFGYPDETGTTTSKSYKELKWEKYNPNDLNKNKISYDKGRCIFSINQVNGPEWFKDNLCVFLNLHGKKQKFSMDDIRDTLLSLGYEDSVGMDGSGSAFMYRYDRNISFNEGMVGFSNSIKFEARIPFLCTMILIGGDPA